jgi:glycosyltransferase involved in cell wall biosynthesis
MATLLTRAIGSREVPGLLTPGGEPRVAYVSSYPPRECGVATFCEDLLHATHGGRASPAPIVIAMEGGDRYRRYARPVVHVADDRNDEDYQAAAEFINDSPAEVVSLQHEFGLYGGLESRSLYRFLGALRKPLITTLHTVLPEPDPAVREMTCALAEKSGRLMVMNPIASQILCRDYGLSPREVCFVHHGAPPPSPEPREVLKARLGLAGRRVMCTFGLVGASKGLEYAIQALPALVRAHPGLVYVIVGQTHPGALHDGVDSYREGLARLTGEIGVEDNVRFVNRYLGKEEITAYLAASDIYLTPYLNPRQICSGTLAYAVAAGRAIISTPYLHARFFLGGGRGLLAEFADAKALAREVARVLETPGLQAQLEARTRVYGQRLLWPEVGARYRRLLREVVRRQPSSPRARLRPAVVPALPPTPAERPV